MSNLILPRKYDDKSGKYPEHHGKNKLSYSQINSWKDPKYSHDYIKQYFTGIEIPSGVYANYGSACGTFIEGIGTQNMECHNEYKHLLSEYDRDVLTNNIEYPNNTAYEDLIVLDCGDFVIEGFIDRSIYLNDKKLIVEDIKTGSVKNKSGFYKSDDYKQTNLYSYAKEKEGYIIEDCRVIMFDRAGNNSEKSPIRLTGKVEIIPTYYNREKFEEWLKNVSKVAKEISDVYKTYLKYFNNG